MESADRESRRLDILSTIHDIGLGRAIYEYVPYANDTRTRNRYQKTCTGFCRCVIGISIDFFPVPKSGKELNSVLLVAGAGNQYSRDQSDWSDDRKLCCLFSLYKLCCLLFLLL